MPYLEPCVPATQINGKPIHRFGSNHCCCWLCVGWWVVIIIPPIAAVWRIIPPALIRGGTMFTNGPWILLVVFTRPFGRFDQRGLGNNINIGREVIIRVNRRLRRSRRRHARQVCLCRAPRFSFIIVCNYSSYWSWSWSWNTKGTHSIPQRIMSGLCNVRGFVKGGPSGDGGVGEIAAGSGGWTCGDGWFVIIVVCSYGDGVKLIDGISCNGCLLSVHFVICVRFCWWWWWWWWWWDHGIVVIVVDYYDIRPPRLLNWLFWWHHYCCLLLMVSG